MQGYVIGLTTLKHPKRWGSKLPWTDDKKFTSCFSCLVLVLYVPVFHGSSSILRSPASVPCSMSTKTSTRVPQVTGCRPSPSSDHRSRICRQACSTCLSFSLTARMIPPRKWSARASFSQSAETSSTTLTTLPLTPTNLCSCHISGLSPARRKYTCYHGTYYTSTDMTVHHTLYGNTIGSQICRLCLHVWNNLAVSVSAVKDFEISIITRLMQLLYAAAVTKINIASYPGPFEKSEKRAWYPLFAHALN